MTAELRERVVGPFGWRPSLPDARDVIADASGLPVLPEVDPRAELPPVFDQGQLGSCTANAVAAAIEYDARLNGDDFGTPSRLFIYYGERQLEGTLGRGDTGAMGRDGFKVAQRVGVPPESDWRYDVSQFQARPSPQSYTDAGAHKIGQYRAVPRRQHDMMRVLTNRQTIAFGFTVYESFDAASVASTGVVPVPDVSRERVLGGHEVLLVGYLNGDAEHALVRNSWGSSWGMGGYCRFPWRILLDASMSSDFRTIARPAGA